MTVKDLFTSLSFDEIATALKYSHQNDESLRDTAAYKEAYDHICHLEFDGEGGDVTFDVTPREEWFVDRSLPLIANNVEGDYWENTIGKTVVCPDNNPFTDAQLAGAILWGMTFYGFSKRDKYFDYDGNFGEYSIKAQLLERRLYLPYINGKSTIRKLKKHKTTSCEHDVAFTMEFWDAIDYRQLHQNRSKRMRFHRLEKRIEWLRKMDRRMNLISRLGASIGNASSDTLYAKILQAKEVLETFRESRAYSKISRVEYLKDLINNYDQYIIPDLFSRFDEIIIVALATKDFPVTEYEFDGIKSIFDNRAFANNTKLTLLKGIDLDCGTEITLQIIAIR